ncbi:serine hydrolase [Sphingopyxis sp. JAI128]|uniref:serine hydrolase domain-containing protein n=1 Tax=Sphingopyxis sp. JAI128 TaxID=2723066 RepID=UPI00161484E3|nr:serine hydrolase domain-containing protein [Sphingopyxis sp. JAI128]MBB6428163.1 CubicO group peptidase (beta-lactamase class C family) [Sphingopyxis sp. JAI128]
MRPKKVSVSLAAALTSVSVGTTSTAAQESARVQAAIAEPQGLVTPGCTAGVFRNGKIAVLAASGAADIDTHRALNVDTQFNAASVSKQFTALAVNQLVAKGEIGLNDDVRRWLPELPDYGHPITVAMLLHHTAGIRNDFWLMAWAGHASMSAVTRAEALQMVLRQKHVDFEPGTRFAYSNGGYLLLSEIVARVSGLPFEVYVQRKILSPLGMARSFILAGRPSGDTNLAKGYSLEGGKVTLANDHSLFGGSGGLMTTIGDLARWDHDIDSGHVVWTPQIKALMLEPGRYTDGSVVAYPGKIYAAGILLGPRWFSHTGGLPGFRTLYARLPDGRTGVALLCNRGDVDVWARANAVIAALDGGLPPVNEPAPLPPALYGRFRSEDLGVLYDFTPAADGAVTLAVLPDGANQPRRSLLLQRLPDGSYFPLDGDKLVPDANGDRFTIESGSTRMEFSRVRAP